MGLINLETNLKSLRYSKDTLGGGNSREPLVTQSIPGSFSNIGDTGGTDFLLRANAFGASARDASRLTQLLTSTSRGRLFTAKQNLLSLTNVDSAAGYFPYLPPSISLKGVFQSNADTFLGKAFEIGSNIVKVGGAIVNTVTSVVSTVNPFNQGVYTPDSTIIQAGGNAFGTHLNKQGPGPLAGTITKLFGIEFGELPTYLNTIGGLGIEGPKTRMQGLFTKQLSSPNPSNTNLISYTGGPGATLGVGRTIIKVAPGQPSGRGSSVFLTFNDPRYNSGNGNSVTNRFVLSQNEINLITPVGIGAGATYQNFSAPLVSESVPQSIPWGTNPLKRMDERVNLGDPGKRANRSSYTIGRRGLGETSPDTAEGNSRYDRALDKLNALPLYQSTGPADTPFTTKERNDLVKFRIGVINNNNPSKKTYIHFRALIDSMSDNYSSEWEAQKFMGRGENFYKYSGFDRQISLSWTVAAQSKQELIPMYQKLNYLASVCAPDYSSNGYMRGNLISLTVGGWCYEQIGIMKGINLEVPTESPWEIGIDDTMAVNDSSVKELPMIVKVTGFTFVPIHNFVPKIQRNFYGGNKNPAENANGPISTYGNEKYIGLTTSGDGDNYNGENGNINYTPQPSNNGASDSNTNVTEQQTTSRSSTFPGGRGR